VAACSRCHADPCTCSNLPHCAGDPFDPESGDDKADRSWQPPPEFYAPKPAPPPRTLPTWDKPCSACGADDVETVDFGTYQDPMNSLYEVESWSLRCRACGHLETV
jgi:hypothetical protein